VIADGFAKFGTQEDPVSLVVDILFVEK